MSQSSDVFRSMTTEESLTFFQGMRDEVRPLYRQAEIVSAAIAAGSAGVLRKAAVPEALRDDSQGAGDEVQRGCCRGNPGDVFHRPARGGIGRAARSPRRSSMKKVRSRMRIRHSPKRSLDQERDQEVSRRREPGLPFGDLESVCGTVRDRLAGARRNVVRGVERSKAASEKNMNRAAADPRVSLSWTSLGCEEPRPGASWGEWIDTSGETIASISPADGSEIGRVKLATRKDTKR